LVSLLFTKPRINFGCMLSDFSPTRNSISRNQAIPPNLPLILRKLRLYQLAVYKSPTF
jgi:hypothetical protein